jgi:hypothetical protein
MEKVYFDCTSGVSGNMVIGAMIDAGMPVEYLKTEIDKVLKEGSYGLDVVKLGTEEHSYTYFNTTDEEGGKDGNVLNNMDAAGAAALIQGSSLDEDVKEKFLQIFWSLVAAKAKVHRTSKVSVTFRYEGLIDTIIDILGAVVSLRYFGIQKVVTSPLNAGSGKLIVGKGEMAIPAPMTRILLRNVPHYSNSRTGELVTPTGAAIISSLADEFQAKVPADLVLIGSGAATLQSGTEGVLRIYGDPEGSRK